MLLIIGYLVVFSIAAVLVVTIAVLGLLPAKLEPIRVAIACASVGGIGGCVYCLRSVYLNACVYKRWDDDWQPWYYIRPVVSVACGGVAYVFLSAGLLILESGQRNGSTDFGFYAFAFIAGLNVDKFIGKLEDIAQSVWGIEKSRAASNSDRTNETSLATPAATPPPNPPATPPEAV